MFERITFRKQNKEATDRPIDMGLLLEAFLFYKKTFVITDQGILSQLLRVFDFDLLNELVDRGILEIVYTETSTGIYTNSQPNAFAYHSPIIFSSPQHTFPIEIRKLCIKHADKEGKGRRNARRLEQRVKVVSHDSSLAESARKLLLDNDFLQLSVPEVLRAYVPEITSLHEVIFKTENTEKGIVVSTNLDFEKLNIIYHRRIPPSHSSLSPALILSHIYDIETDLYFSSRQLSEIATTPLATKLISARMGHLARRCCTSDAQKDAFQDLIFKDNKSIREAFNTGKIELETVIKAIFEADKFKDWLCKQDVDTDLVKQYYKEVTKDSLIDHLPAKSIRWSLFTGLGILSDIVITGGLGTIAGLSLSLLDAFILDKLIKGWRPNQFVEEDLEKLIKNEW
ncbi:MAG TPA: hypothetical protein VEM15_17400 [Thermodesulfobacteriota bacterium]|nr:hypothetical protein [Thermodesulfobacteriota bacterium]